MTRCFCLTESRNRCYRSSLAKHGLRPILTDLHDCFSSTAIHLYLPKSPDPSKPNLLLFFGCSYTDLPDCPDSFQARCIARALKVHSVARFSLVGLSYGGFVGYSWSLNSRRRWRGSLCDALGCAWSRRDLKVFSVTDLEEAVRILVPEMPDRLRELVGYILHKEPPI